MSQVSITGIIAVGLTFVILTAEIDLSVAAVANAVGITMAYFTLQPDYVNIANIPLPGIIAIVLTLLTALAFGLITAFGVTWIGIPSFIMTLAIMQIANGVSALLVRGQIAYSYPEFITMLGSGTIFGVRWTIVVCLTLPARRASRPHLHALRPLCVHGRRQSRGGGIFRRQRQD